MAEYAFRKSSGLELGAMSPKYRFVRMGRERDPSGVLPCGGTDGAAVQTLENSSFIRAFAQR